ncbi:MAG: type II secretion system protein [Verrucomicrobiota bacterium]|nr:type II secretion system protein [Verrucomicrobiota bacterium]
MTRAGIRRAAGKHRAGFTLLELLIVMSIIFIVMGMAMAAWFGIVRGSAIRGGLSNLHRVISLARQHAMTHGASTYVFFRQDNTDGLNARYWVCSEAGRHYGEDGVAQLDSGYPRWNDTLKGGTIYNLTAGSWGVVADNSPQTLTVVGGKLTGGKRDFWNRGDKFGWLAHEIQFLPSTLKFDNAEENNAPEGIIFFPDGATPKSGAANYVITIKEKNGAGRREIRVLGLTGLVEISE